MIADRNPGYRNWTEGVAMATGWCAKRTCVGGRRVSLHVAQSEKILGSPRVTRSEAAAVSDRASTSTGLYRTGTRIRVSHCKCWVPEIDLKI